MQLSKSLLLYGIVIIVLSGFNKTSEQNCDAYKTGKFYIFNKTRKQKINIERKDSLQIETNELTGDITISKVKWTGPCDYELFFNYMTPKEVSKDTTVKRVFDANVDTPLQIKILSGTDSYYVFEANKDGFQTLRDTVWLVK
jgi:translation initiation factor IF-1